MNNLPNNKKYNLFGKVVSPEDLKRYGERTTTPPYLSRIDNCLTMVGKGKILEIGCSTGYFSYLLSSDKDRDIIGIDILKDSVEIANDLFGSNNLKFDTMDGEHLNFPPNTFDYVILMELLEHVNSPHNLLKDIYNILKPGGKIIISTPNSTSIKEIFDNLSLPFQKKPFYQRVNTEERGTGGSDDHIYIWDIVKLYRLLNRVGFKYVKHDFCKFCLPQPFVRLYNAEMKWLQHITGRFSEIIIIVCEK